MARIEDEDIEVEAELVHETDKAWLVNIGSSNKIWVPKSVAQYDRDSKCLILPEWQANARGLI